ncbi:MAG: hypothetical protein KatS3mg060_2056 [Dehalococcoidia bacterium]|nr:MAG: hypothetical protein KatS3mg060_2056 [Dehalococcoidia bacterium]
MVLPLKAQVLKALAELDKSHPGKTLQRFPDSWQSDTVLEYEGRHYPAAEVIRRATKRKYSGASWGTQWLRDLGFKVWYRDVPHDIPEWEQMVREWLFTRPQYKDYADSVVEFFRRALFELPSKVRERAWFGPTSGAGLGIVIGSQKVAWISQEHPTGALVVETADAVATEVMETRKPSSPLSLYCPPSIADFQSAISRDELWCSYAQACEWLTGSPLGQKQTALSTSKVRVSVLIGDYPPDAPPVTKTGVDSSETFELVLATLRDQGLYFSDELVANYLLALQTKRFVILTGISGTGKTKLAIAVAKCFAPRAAEPSTPTPSGETTLAPKNYEVVAVRPDWTDGRGLLGYFNPLTETYHTTPFLNLLLRALDEWNCAQKEGRNPQPFFLILDEMNLARVEHYFSDFLSALESGERITLHHAGSEEINRIPASLWVPPNLYFTGTVNVDETTYMFSPKVLDRAFTIELNEVELGKYSNPLDRAESDWSLPRLPNPLPPYQPPQREDWEAFGTLLESALRDTVTALNERLRKYHRHFGYRVANEIARFVLLAAEQENDTSEWLWDVLDLALLQKVLPKFHGTQQELEQPLVELLAFAKEPLRQNEGQKNGEPTVPSDGGNASTARLRRFENKVQRMLDRLRTQGFTAYVE